MDADAFRRESRAGWNASAEGWQAEAERFGRSTMPVSEWLVDALAPQPGHHVLELAAGTGEVGLLLAELVAPGGEVIISDFAPGMLSSAQERAGQRGLAGVRFKQIDAESIDLDAASQDGVVCRWGLMLMADPEAALREIRRVLRPGRPLAFAVWAGPEHNPWREAFDAALGSDPAGEGPGMFAWSDRELVAARLEAAGFSEHEIEPLDFTMDYADTDDWIDTTVRMSRRLRDVFAGDPGLRERLRGTLADAARDHVREDGTLAVPARSWVAWASA